jgi:ribosomal protein S18 acetylase RimI-like enzyme
MDVRRLTADDAPAYRALRLRSFREHPESFTTSAEELEAQPLADSAKRLTDPRLKFWGAFEGGALCGSVGLELDGRVKNRHRGKVVGMYVPAEGAGRGIGRALLETLVADARASGLELLVLSVTQGNSRAAKLYERCGFRSFGIEPRAIKVAGRAYAKNHMVLELTPS